MTVTNENDSQWSGPRFPDKSSFWHGLPKDADLTGTNAANPAVLPNICPADGRCTKSGGIDMREDWIARFVLKNADADLRNMTLNEYARIAHVSAQEYSSIIGTSDPDLSDFRRRGGKIIMYHGMVSLSNISVSSAVFLVLTHGFLLGRFSHSVPEQHIILRCSHSKRPQDSRLLSPVLGARSQPLFWWARTVSRHDF